MARKSIIEDIRKDQIIESAIDALASVGYTKTTLDQIAETADISRGVITYYFRSKDQLISEVMNRILTDQKQIIMGRVDEAASPRERLAEYIGASIDHMKSDRRHYEAQVELWSNLEYKKEFNQKIYRGCIEIVSKILKEGIEAGVFRDVGRPECRGAHSGVHRRDHDPVGVQRGLRRPGHDQGAPDRYHLCLDPALGALRAGSRRARPAGSRPRHRNGERVTCQSEEI